ncbi:MAG: ChbG/HpnK family deacetylase [Acidimicrobiia bacterium]
MNARDGAPVTKPQSLSIVAPMLNETESVGALIEAVRTAADDLLVGGFITRCELVLVDDGSTDGTADLAEELAAGEPWIRVVRHRRNRGLGGALKTGFAASTGDLVLYTDADLPFDLGEIARACRLMGAYGADIVSGYRHDRTSEGPRRAVYSFFYNHLIRFVFGLRVRDVNFACKLVSRRVLDTVTLRSEGSFIDAELLVRADRAGFKIMQIGLDYFPRSRGVSTLSSAATIERIVRDVVRLRNDVVRDPVERPARPLLVVNADDYGLTEGVSRGILRAHADGIVTSTSVLALGSAFEQTSAWLDDAPDLGVGAHLALVGEDPPLLAATEIPTLVDGRGRLAASWRQLLPRLLAGRVDPDDLRRELAAQLERIAGLGHPLTHVDTHQHLHLWPAVADVVLELARARGVDAVRVPRASSVTPRSIAVNRLAVGLERRATASSFRYPVATAGFEESGRLDDVALHQALTGLASSGAATAELLVHPGTADDPGRARYPWGYRWEDELDALTGEAARAEVARHGFVLGTYADLADR